MAENSLIQKIAMVSASVGSLKPDKRNTQQNYNYISADKILERVGTEMAKVGLVVIPALVDEHIDAVPWKQGHRYDCRVDLEMTIADGDGNTSAHMWFGRGSDYSVPDKAMYKAITSGHKYFLKKLFNVGEGNEDGEHENVPAPNANGTKQQEQQVPALLKDNARLRRQLHAAGTTLYGKEWDSKRADMSAAFEVGSSNEWTIEQAQKVLAGMNKRLSERKQAEPQPLFPENGGGAYAE